MSDLGDLGAFLKEGSTSNLDWLEVDPAEYRAESVLPKQNLDVGPDLEALWAHDDRPASTYVANKGSLPHTMGDMSQEHGHLRADPEDIRKVARVVLMQSPDIPRFQDALLRRFDRDSLRGARAVLAAVLSERGLLGKFYIDAADFAGCHKGASHPIEFARRYTSEAPYVLAKPACGNCVHAAAAHGAQVCGVFHKEIKIQVPYSAELAAEVEQAQRARGKLVEAAAQEPRARIRLALLAPDQVIPGVAPMPKPRDNVARLMRPVEAHDAYRKPLDLTSLRQEAKVAVKTALGVGRITVSQAQDAYRIVAAATDEGPLQVLRDRALGVEAAAPPTYQGGGQQKVAGPVSGEVVAQQIIAAAGLTRKRDEAARQLVATEKARPLVDLLRRELLKGRGGREVVAALHQAFPGADFQSFLPHLAPMLKEAGLFGVIYTTQDSFEDCRTGADFLATHNPGIRGVVAGQKCSDCIYRKVGRCLMYGKPLVREAHDLYSSELVEHLAKEHQTAGYDVSAAFLEAPKGPRAVLAAMHQTVRAQLNTSRLDMGPGRLATPIHRMGQPQALPQTKYLELRNREVVKFASRYLNEGLYGVDLLEALRGKFEASDITAATSALRPVVAEQGLQGIHYVDPTVYDDYGKGCKEASSLHRSRLVPYVKLGAKCISCVHQTKTGFCSVLNKPLVVEPPYVDKAAQQRGVLASGKATVVSYESLMNNGLTMMAEYQLQNGGLEVEISPERPVDLLSIRFGEGR